MYDIFNNFLFSSAVSKIYHKKEWGNDDNKPWYFAIEGIDGAGKTYFANELETLLRHEKLPYLRVKEPFKEIDPVWASADDFQKDRENYYKDFKEREKWIISDRSFLSTWAYQNCSEKMETRIKKWIHSKDGLGSWNLCLVFLNSGYDESQRNIEKRGEGKEAIENLEIVQRKALLKYRMAMHREIFDFDALVKVTPNILP